MRINERSTNMEISVQIRDYLHKKLEHLEKLIDLSDESVMCDVEIGKTTNHHKNGEVFRTEINININGKRLRAVSEKDDIFASIDLAKDEMIRELKSNKDKKVNLVRRGGAKAKDLIRGIFRNDKSI